MKNSKQAGQKKERKTENGKRTLNGCLFFKIYLNSTRFPAAYNKNPCTEKEKRNEGKRQHKQKKRADIAAGFFVKI